MIHYVFSYDFAPGLGGRLEEFMTQRGYPYWLSRPGVKEIQVYTKLGSSPMVETHVVIDGFASFEKASSSEEYHELQREVAGLVSASQHHFLLERQVYRKD